MNNQIRLHELQGGEALALPGPAQGRLTLVEGEVLLQPAPLYLAGTVVVPPAQRFAAPASLPPIGAGTLRAAGRARVAVDEAPGIGAALKSAFAFLRQPVRSTPPAAAR